MARRPSVWTIRLGRYLLQRGDGLKEGEVGEQVDRPRRQIGAVHAALLPLVRHRQDRRVQLLCGIIIVDKMIKEVPASTGSGC